MKKDWLRKFSNSKKSNNLNQDKIVVELREKLMTSEMMKKDTETTLTELKKPKEITKQSIAECQTKTVKLIKEKKRSEETIKTLLNFNTIKINVASDQEFHLKNL